MIDVDSRLHDLFLLQTGIDFSDESSNMDIALLGSELRIAERELLLILFKIEEEFEIVISEDDILDGEFQTYRKVLLVIKRNLVDDRELL